jgi:predicted amidohydrolase
MPSLSERDVRLQLAALRCEKGDIAGNLAVHLDAVDAAAASGVDVVVFPEMSLTGSVDPGQRPEHLVDVADARVRTLVDATGGDMPTVVFGIAERDGERAYITQCIGRDGQLVGVHRKRHLGEGEQAFDVGTGARVFDHAGVPFGLLICAESGVDFPVDDLVAAGARLVLMCAAPGLDGRRDTDDAFARGLTWWESSGLRDAQRHAARHRVWIALATQAGATVDEDFPGLAALIDDDGTVVARTPDWRAAMLVVDVPIG